MGAPGKSVVVEGGKRGALLGGKSAVYNAEESCPACCIEFSQTWSFTDVGFIDGGLGLRLDWEDDKNCRNHNTQTATATAEIIVPQDTIMMVTWSGMGGTQDPNYELMSLYVDGSHPRSCVLTASSQLHPFFRPFPPSAGPIRQLAGPRPRRPTPLRRSYHIGAYHHPDEGRGREYL